jgi:anti-anti-sigma factor
VAFMDASTIGILLQARSQLARRSRTLAVRAPSRCARRLIDLCQVSDLIEVDAGAPRATSRPSRPCLRGGPASLN